MGRPNLKNLIIQGIEHEKHFIPEESLSRKAFRKLLIGELVLSNIPGCEFIDDKDAINWIIETFPIVLGHIYGTSGSTAKRALKQAFEEHSFNELNNTLLNEIHQAEALGRMVTFEFKQNGPEEPKSNVKELVKRQRVLEKKFIQSCLEMNELLEELKIV